MTRLQATTMCLLFVAGIATPLTFSRQSPWRREAGLSDRSAAAGRSGRAASTLPGQGAGPNVQAGTNQASAALIRLRQFLEQSDNRLLLPRREGELYRCVEALGREDLPQAWSLRERLRAWGLRDKFGAALMDRWAAVDGPAALAAAAAVSDRTERQRLLDRGVSVWSGTEPKAAFAWVKSFYSEQEQGSKLMLVFYGCGAKQPQVARDLWQQLPAGPRRDKALLTFIDSLAQKDLSAAVACLQDAESSHTRREARCTVLIEWARTDSAAALAWAQSQPRLQERDEAIKAICAGVAQENPAQVGDLLRALSPTALEQDRGAVDEVMRQWAERDLTSAIAWTKQLPEGALRNRMLEELIPQWAGQDARGAARFVQSLPEGHAAGKLLEWVARSWCSQDSRAAMSWVETLPEGVARDAGLLGFADGLAIYKPEQAARFVASLPAGELQTKVALRVVAWWTANDPPSAAAWVEGFPAGQTRERAVAEVLKKWRETDREAAENWRQQVGQPSSRKGRS